MPHVLRRRVHPQRICSIISQRPSHAKHVPNRDTTIINSSTIRTALLVFLVSIKIMRHWLTPVFLLSPMLSSRSFHKRHGMHKRKARSPSRLSQISQPERYSAPSGASNSTTKLSELPFLVPDGCRVGTCLTQPDEAEARVQSVRCPTKPLLHDGLLNCHLVRLSITQSHDRAW